MFESLNSFGCRPQGSTQLTSDKLPVSVNLPHGFQGKMVPASIVVMELLWQHYGLDLLHPVFSRWLERHAPDVKFAVPTGNQDRECASFKVGLDGTIKLDLSVQADDRLRQVSAQYLWSQSLQADEPQAEYRQAS
ncbi:MAG TPA: hypothetical protein VJ302_09180 [Blastocatellia bacterium]|nr:hypothetical protein [Blastocatellia bacterium]